jgi:hypothetical protein
MGASLGVVGSVVGIGSGLNSIFGGGGSSGGGGGGGSTSSGTYDPYGQYRGQAASQLNQLMNNPSLAMSQPGYQQQLQAGQEQSQRGAAATGMLQSGAEAAALQSQGQNTFASYYNSQLANLMQLSGASQSPAAAGLAQQQAATAAQARQFGALNQVTSGLGGLAGSNLFSNPNQTSSQNIAGYASSGAGYQQSFGPDTQFGSYDSGAYQGPV